MLGTKLFREMLISQDFHQTSYFTFHVSLSSPLQPLLTNQYYLFIKIITITEKPTRATEITNIIPTLTFISQLQYLMQNPPVLTLQIVAITVQGTVLLKIHTVVAYVANYDFVMFTDLSFSENGVIPAMQSYTIEASQVEIFQRKVGQASSILVVIVGGTVSLAVLAPVHGDDVDILAVLVNLQRIIFQNKIFQITDEQVGAAALQVDNRQRTYRTVHQLTAGELLHQSSFNALGALTQLIQVAFIFCQTRAVLNVFQAIFG
ncbi:hypothetical protein SS50377_21350 [Spironucleus salmonicida]|uniref:Uncharacterized protein n=1 Tax=Spironucleus salmonicida TaxID=348837 RepID=A0A9P8S0L4_9EUKA|nr:hypothetical protein SS50377_21350 [Spironucleus salmonicida]